MYRTVSPLVIHKFFQLTHMNASRTTHMSKGCHSFWPWVERNVTYLSHSFWHACGSQNREMAPMLAAKSCQTAKICDIPFYSRPKWETSRAHMCGSWRIHVCELKECDVPFYSRPKWVWHTFWLCCNRYPLRCGKYRAHMQGAYVKRALSLMKRALSFMKRALSLMKRALSLMKRALSLMKRIPLLMW